MKSIVCIYAVGFLLLAGLLWFDWLLLLVPFFPLFLGGLVFAICWALCCRSDKSLHLTAASFTVVETGILLALLFLRG